MRLVPCWDQDGFCCGTDCCLFTLALPLCVAARYMRTGGRRRRHMLYYSLTHPYACIHDRTGSGKSCVCAFFMCTLGSELVCQCLAMAGLQHKGIPSFSLVPVSPALLCLLHCLLLWHARHCSLPCLNVCLPPNPLAMLFCSSPLASEHVGYIWLLPVHGCLAWW